jgi:hypothetical protein
MLVTKNKTIILNLIDNGSRYITYSVDKDRFMLNKDNGEILYPEMSKFNAAELIEIAKHLVSLWKQNSRELPMFIELNLN